MDWEELSPDASGAELVIVGERHLTFRELFDIYIDNSSLTKVIKFAPGQLTDSVVDLAEGYIFLPSPLSFLKVLT